MVNVWSGRGQGLLETLGYVMGEREEGRNGGVVGSEVMLSGGMRE